jgi:predicted transcriptional regulator
VPKKQPNKDVLAFTQKEASSSFDYYVNHFQGFNSKAANSIQLNLAIIGLLLTVSSILVSGNKADLISQFVKEMFPVGILGLIALIFSFILSLSILQPYTYAGLGSSDLRQIYQGDFDKNSLINQLVLSYEVWLRNNEKESKKIRRRLALSYYLTIIFIISLIFVYISSFNPVDAPLLEKEYFQSGVLFVLFLISLYPQYLSKSPSSRVTEKVSKLYFSIISPFHHPSPHWMTLPDRKILYFLSKSGGYFLPSVIRYNTNLSSQDVRGRLPILKSYGLVLGSRRGKWKISNLGIDFINGEIDIEDLQESTRHPASWMLPIDDSLLKILEETQLNLSPTTLRKNVHADWESVKGRLEILEEYELVVKESGKYQITQLGEDYLSGSIDASNLSPS